MSLIAKFAELNDADLSKISDRLEKLREEMERDLSIKARSNTTTGAAASTIVSKTAPGLTAEQLLKELQRTKRSAS